MTTNKSFWNVRRNATHFRISMKDTGAGVLILHESLGCETAPESMVFLPGHTIVDNDVVACDAATGDGALERKLRQSLEERDEAAKVLRQGIAERNKRIKVLEARLAETPVAPKKTVPDRLQKLIPKKWAARRDKIEGND